MYQNIVIARKNYKAACECDQVWFNSREIGEMLGKSRTWAWNQIRNGKLKAKVDESRGVNKKYYVVHIDEIGKFLNSF